MTRALVTLVTLAVGGCATGQPSKPAAPASPAAPPSPAAAPTQPAPAPAPATPAPAPAAPAPTPAPAVPAAVPAPRILYVKTHLANCREGAGTSAKILRVLQRGARLQVLETRSDWLRIRLDDGQEGWVAESVTSATAP